MTASGLSRSDVDNQETLVGGYTREFSSVVLPQATVSQPLFRNPAFIHTDLAGNTPRVLWRLLGQAKGGPALLMSLHRYRQGIIGSLPDAI
jgi:hypothetical protein